MNACPSHYAKATVVGDKLLRFLVEITNSGESSLVAVSYKRRDTRIDLWK
jgi:hypothetical protein